VTVTPTANDPGATIQVDGQNTDSGKASAEIQLKAGEAKEIDVEVTAQDGKTKKQYKIEATEEH
jgi:subtilase family serine protease